METGKGALSLAGREASNQRLTGRGGVVLVVRMLTIYAQKDAGRAKNYFWGYYTEGGQELPGVWGGKGAVRLGLSGAIERGDWNALCENRDPNAGETLTVRQKDGRRVLYDFTFNAPKSVSLLYGLTRDERVLGVFREAVDETMGELEAEMQARVRHSGKMEDRTTGSMVYGKFTHLTARPVDGVPDPSLHMHVAVLNATYDSEEERWKAGQFAGLMRDRKYFEAVFHSKLARKFEELGLSTKRTPTGWDLDGLDKTTLDKFSRRTAQIEERARALGITNAVDKHALGAKTRGAKVDELTMGELERTWRDWLTTDEAGSIEALEKSLGAQPVDEDVSEASGAIQRAIAHAFARQSVVPERQLIAGALRQGYGRVSRETVEAEMARADLIRVKRDDGRMWVTSTGVLEEETRMLAFARQGRGTMLPIAPGRSHVNRAWLNAEQRRAVSYVLTSRDRVMSIRGAAGVGKTSSLEEIREAVEEVGGTVFAVAPSAGASRGELRESGFATADTVARLLKDEKLQKEIRGSLLIVDEAGMVGSEDMGKLFTLAERQDLRVLLVGDLRQHGSVARGTALRLLEDQAGITPVEITAIQRQKRAEYRGAVGRISDGDIAGGFSAFDRLGWIHEIPEAERYHALAKAYADAVQSGKSSLIVSPTHGEGRVTTGAIREELRSRGLLGEEERQLDVLRPAQLTLGQKMDVTSYATGDVLCFHQNAKGFKKGERLRVVDGAPVPLDQAQRFELFRADRIGVSVGDRLRVTQGGKTKDGRHALNNGDLFTVEGFTKAGDLVVQNDRQKKSGRGESWTISKDFGHLAHGFVVTSHASQGKTVDRVFVSQSSRSFPASSREQFYVSVSRAREQVQLFTDDKAELLAAVTPGDERLSATELVGDFQPQAIIRRRLIEQTRNPEPVLSAGTSRERELELER